MFLAETKSSSKLSRIPFGYFPPTGKKNLLLLPLHLASSSETRLGWRVLPPLHFIHRSVCQTLVLLSPFFFVFLTPPNEPCHQLHFIVHIGLYGCQTLAMCVCLLVQDLSSDKVVCGAGRGTVKDICYEVRRAGEVFAT